MKVKDLIEKLKILDQNLEVILTCEDPEIVNSDRLVMPFEINDISAHRVELSRDAMRRPQIGFSETGEGRLYALIDITSDM